MSFWLSDAICPESEAMVRQKLRSDQWPLLLISTLAALSRLSGKTDRPRCESRQTKICCLTLRPMFRATHCICAHGSTFGLPTESKSSSQVQREQVERSGAPSS